MSEVRSRSTKDAETAVPVLAANNNNDSEQHTQWDEKRYQSQSTINMLDMLISFVLSISLIVFIVVFIYLYVLSESNLHLNPSGEEPELRPEIVAMIAMEAILAGMSCLLFKTRRMPEGKVVIFTITVAINALLLGFALSTIFRKILKGVS
jgi:amino acid transporter